LVENVSPIGGNKRVVADEHDTQIWHQNHQLWIIFAKIPSYPRSQKKNLLKPKQKKTMLFFAWRASSVVAVNTIGEKCKLLLWLITAQSRP